jgi:hypothetical protein
MSAEEFAAQLERLIVQGRAAGLTDEAIIAGLQAAAEALDGGLRGFFLLGRRGAPAP